MTNGELIELLKQYPKDMKIDVFDYMEGVSAGTVEKVYVKNGKLVLHCNWEECIED